MKITKENLQEVYKSKRASIETMELKGYELIENLFVDSSGCGSPDEPAYTQSQFMQKMNEILAQEGLVYTSITDAGQFQVYVGVFKKTGKKRGVKLENNTYEHLENGKRSIRLHDTDILTFEGNAVTLNNGGYFTHTSKDRINKYLPRGFSVHQKNFQWYVNIADENKTIEFKNGMILEVK